MLNWEWYTDIPAKTLFLHLMLTVNEVDKTWKGVEVKRGSIITGLHKLSSETGLSVQQLRTAMNKLKSTGEITINPTSKFSIITVCNFDEYQNSEMRGQQAEQQAVQLASSKQSTTTKEYKNIKIKEENTLDRFEEFWTAYPRKINKAGAKKAWVKNKCDNGKFDSIMEALNRQIVANNWTRENAQFTPHPATWINGERWNDEIIAVQGKQNKCITCKFQSYPVCKNKTDAERVGCGSFVEKEE